MTLAAAKPPFFPLKHHSATPTRTRLASDPCKKSTGPWRTAVTSSTTTTTGNNGGAGGGDSGEDDDDETCVSTRLRTARRQARLTARRRESIRLKDVLDEAGAADARGIGEFLRHPAGVESLLNTRALQGFAPSESEPNTFRCTLHRIRLLGFHVTPVLDLRVTPTCSDCTVEMLSCRFEGTESIQQQNELFSAFMRNHITWAENGEEPCLDIDVDLAVTLEVYTKPFSLLPLSAVEKPGNLLMQSLLDRLVPMLGQQLLRDYHLWVQQQSEVSS